jgi:L-fuculose-phosphate aldolase
MKRIVTDKDLRAAAAAGADMASLVAGSLLTPGAQDALLEINFARRPPAPAKPDPLSAAVSERRTPAGVPIAIGSHPELPNQAYEWKPGSDPKTSAEMQKFFSSPPMATLKQKMVEIGQRVWRQGYVDGNGGNITVRVGDNLVLCTPTLVSKGFMSIEDICLVDLDGHQVAGSRPRTSEVNTHLAILKAEPAARACVHAHPPHATAFAVASVRPPTCLIPEPEVFLGEIGLAEYQTPGTPENAQAVGALAPKHQAILMENHGVIVWGKDLEDAYWKMENTDAYCRIVWIASHLGRPLKQYSQQKLKELIAIRQKLGMPDARGDLKECELCDNDEFRPGVVCMIPPVPAASCGCSQTSPSPAFDPAAEVIVRQITDQLLTKLS